jgi:hypothetical protein
MRRRLGRMMVLLLLGAATTLGVAWVLAVTVDVQQGAASSAETFVGHVHWAVSRYDRAGAAQVRSVRRVGVDWSPQQAAGAPDTPTAGDQVTAWASASADAGEEWLLLHYAKPVIPREVHVYENCAPGALAKVSVIGEDDVEQVAWVGQDPTPQGAPMGTSKVPVDVDVPTNRVRIYLACDKVPGWNEVDAVGLLDEEGQSHWARRVEASSTYASGSRAGGTVGNPMTLIPSWCDLDQPAAAVQAGDANFEDRIVDARGWPMLALYSDRDMTVATAPGVPCGAGTTGAPSGISISGFTGISAVTTPGSGGPVPIPLRPIWGGLAANIAIYAVLWWLLWLGCTVPRRFIVEVARFRRGACIRCGYDLGYEFVAGCPECGWRRDRATPPTAATTAPPLPVHRERAGVRVTCERPTTLDQVKSPSS